RPFRRGVALGSRRDCLAVGRLPCWCSRRRSRRLRVWQLRKAPFSRCGLTLTPKDIRFVRETFGLSQRDLARALNVAPNTVLRWEREPGGVSPVGLQAEVLRALHSTALVLKQQRDEAQKQAAGALVGLGIGALIFHLLTRK